MQPKDYWFILALITAGVAQSLRRSGLLWFLFAIVFGPLALLILVIMGRAEKSADT